jgi:hypothetical protein
MGSFFGIATMFLIVLFCWGKKRRQTPDEVDLSIAPPAVGLPKNSGSAIQFGRRPNTRPPCPELPSCLELPSEVSNAGEIYELQGHGRRSDATIPPSVVNDPTIQSRGCIGID